MPSLIGSACGWVGFSCKIVIFPTFRILPMLLRFRGRNALSSFRLEKLVGALATAAPQVSHICAEHWYFCATSRTLEQHETVILEGLLDGAAKTANKRRAGGRMRRGRTVAGCASTGNNISMVNEGHGYRPPVRVKGGGASGARNCILYSNQG